MNETIMNAIDAERARQDLAWGEQNHPSFDPVLLARLGGPVADRLTDRLSEQYEIPSPVRARFCTHAAAQNGYLNWMVILQEEVSELTQWHTPENEPRLRDELVQVAAVCVAWLESLERNRADAAK